MKHENMDSISLLPMFFRLLTIYAFIVISVQTGFAQASSFADQRLQPSASQDGLVIWDEDSNSMDADPPLGSSWFESSDSPRTSGLPSSGRPKGIPIGLGYSRVEDSEVGLSIYDTNLKVPLLRFFGSPPPIVSFGFAYSDLSTPVSFELPSDFYETTVGLSWVRQVNERWTLRFMLGIGFATDTFNTSSDAWQFRGGVFGIYRSSERWTWTVGAIALGRRDLPVLPAIGAVYQPNPSTRYDLILPKPKANFLISDDGNRQQWFYLGGGLNGNSWGYEKPGQVADILTYSDVRVVAGWHSRPSAPPGVPFVVGRKYDIEIGYAFSRDLETDRGEVEVSLGDAVTLTVSTRF